MDIKFLQTMLYRYYHYGISPGARSSYSSSQTGYLNFCSMIQHNPIPAHKSTILLFVMHLATSGLSHTTIKVYLSAVCSMHVATDQHTVFNQQLTPQLQQVLKRIQHTQPISNPPWIRRPITLDIMKAIFSLLLKKSPSYKTAMLCAARCTAFFGFLHSSEMTVPSQDTYDPTIHLSIQDVAVDNKSSPSMVRILIKQSKTNLFHQGVYIYLGRIGNAICPVKAILSYLALEGDVSGPLFIFQTGKMPTHQIFSDTLDGLLDELHFKKENFNSHSFRIGTATSAKAANISDTHIKMLGRWKSNAYKLYIQTPLQEIADLSRVLAAGVK